MAVPIFPFFCIQLPNQLCILPGLKLSYIIYRVLLIASSLPGVRIFAMQELKYLPGKQLPCVFIFTGNSHQRHMVSP